MDQHTLWRLAEAGIGALPPAELRALADWCHDFGEISGDARYISLAGPIGRLADTFDEQDEAGGVSTHFVRAIDGVIGEWMPSVLSAELPQDGALAARALRQSINEVYRALDP